MKTQHEISVTGWETWRRKLVAGVCAVALALLSVPLGVFQAPEIAKADTYAVPADAQASGTSGTCTWYITSASAETPGQLVIYPTGGVSGTLGDMGNISQSDVPWNAYSAKVQSVYIAPGVSANTVFGFAFYGFENATCIDVTNLDLSNTEYANDLFCLCKSLTSIPGISGINTSKIKDFSDMFYQCSCLTTLDLSSWDLPSAVRLYNMFYNCYELQTLLLPTEVAPNVTNITQAFMGCKSLTTLDVSCFANGKIQRMSGLFQTCYNLVDLRGYETLATAATTSLSAAFNGCSSMTSLDLSQWDTQNATSFFLLFGGCHNLATIQGLENWATSASEDFGYVFYDCYLLDDASLSGIVNWDVSQSDSFEKSFNNCRTVTSLDLSRWNNSIATSLYYTFTGCSALRTLDISGFDTSQANDMTAFFGALPNLRVVTLGSHFSFTGDGSTSCVLPTPDSYYIPGAMGKWRAVSSGTIDEPAGTIYDPADVPSNTAETYVVLQATLDVDVPIKVILAVDAAGNFVTPTAANNMIINHSVIGANVVSAVAAAQSDFSLLSRSALNTSGSYNVFGGSIAAGGGSASDLTDISTTGSKWAMAEGGVSDGSNQIPLQLTGAIKNVKGHYFTEAINVFNITYTFALDL